MGENLDLSFFNIRDLLKGPWKVYKNSSGRQFYHNRELQISSWKPPRNYKPTGTIGTPEDTQEAVMEERPFTIRDIEGQDVVIPGDFVELYDKTSGIKSLTLRG